MSTSTETMPKYCCGCDSRIATLNANIFMLVFSCLYFAVGLAGLNDTNEKTKPNDAERIYLEIMEVITALFIIIAALAIWGACSYRGWPVMLSLGWTTVNMIITAITSFIVVFNTGSAFFLVRGFVMFLIQFSCLFMPMYGYVKEYEKLKELSVAQDMEGGDKQNLELV
ncbi:unnamed protein product [Cylindrotheca closterium]|uniref:Uncharacterized protein n=1 Tax=Cylindrotheca closterium TaxID=2856 RepID=A0AAD2FFJ2_9STRA|nr:unnamed protein product [Cylindrotheca closterium]